MKKTRAKQTAHPGAAARVKARRAILSNAGEEMVAIIRLHVAGCPRCELRRCGEGMADLLQRLDDRLATAAKRSDARTAKQPLPSGARLARRRR
jgi:hypothetical protein